MKSKTLLTRRDFLRTASLGAAAGATVPTLLVGTALGARDDDAPILVLVQLCGGNDGLNTLVPFTDDAYHNARPVIALRPAEVLKLGATPFKDDFGFHPALRPLMSLWNRGGMAVVNGVGYPNSNRSHFRSTEIWHTGADADQTEPLGWLGRSLDYVCPGESAPTLAISLGSDTPQVIKGNRAVSVCYHESVGPQKICELLHRAPGSAADYPDTRFASGLRTIAALIAGGLGARVYCHDICGFDTHADAPAVHARLWTEVSEGLQAFFADLDRRGGADRVLVMAFSEFGRRVAENGSNGTDHGAAGLVFLWGRAVRGGIYGEPPSLAELDHGDLKMTVDFRSVYATVLDHWLGVSHERILGRRFAKLPLLAA
ncbi:MAG: DUF1501 domain-containing protein [Verrucomicrobiae bacterium]|nr:DUF1501 domain-containing protein [Verrucomicrobiae bacterium]